MLKKLSDNELNAVSGGKKVSENYQLTWKGSNITMTDTAQEFDTKTTDLDFEALIKSKWGTPAWNKIKDKTLNTICREYGEAVVQNLLDNAGTNTGDGKVKGSTVQC